MTKFNRGAFGLSLMLVMLVAGPRILLAQEAAKEGWVSLFNGKDLKGWRFHLGQEGADNNGTFTARDGILVCNGKPTGYMYTEKPYRNYTLQLEWAFKRPDDLKDDSKFRGNSGYLIHIGEENALGVWPRSIEVQGAYRSVAQILPIPRNVKCTYTVDKEAQAKALKPVGEWNTIEIDVHGGKMVISVNGAVVTKVTDCELTEGPIGFQSEGVEMHWRNIRIRER